jgi:DNA polymerase I
MAHFAQEPAMVMAFLRGEDVHMNMARAMYGQDAGPKERKKSKSGSLGRQYGIGSKKFAVQQGMSVESAKEFLRFYDSTFPEIPRFIKDVQDLGASRFRDLGESFVVTPAGRKIQLDELEARRGEHYKLVAFACQGYAADLLKLAIAGLDAAGVLEASNFMMPVHDELLSEPLVEDAVELGEEYRRIMTACATLDVPLTADVEIYDKDWSQCV